LLLDAGADIKRRPYSWYRVVLWGNETINDIKKTKDINGYTRSDEEIQRHIKIHIQDVNRILKLFLKYGADPDKKGDLYPYSLEAILSGNMTDGEAEKYFAKGTRPINEAIKKGIAWESQVDLLLEYTTLDADSLKAAEESGDPAMIEKINKLWEEQQKRSIRQ
jgi:hypothetical protein